MATILGTVGAFGFEEDQQGIDYKSDTKVQRDYHGVSKETAQAIDFIRQEDGDLGAHMLAASLTALGIPFLERMARAARGRAATPRRAISAQKMAVWS